MEQDRKDNLWADVREWLTDATRTAIREAEDLTRRGKLKFEIMNLSRQIEKKMAELGGVVYEQMSREAGAPLVRDARFDDLVGEIARLETKRKQVRAEYEAERKRD